MRRNRHVTRVAHFSLALLVSGCHQSPVGQCSGFLTQATWEFAMAAPEGNRLTGEVRVVDGVRRLVGTATSIEGTGEPLDYPLDSLTVHGDSIRFRFAPSGTLVEGKCVDADRIRSRYVVDLGTSFDAMEGTGEFHRKP